jgi:hypothetical protein
MKSKLSLAVALICASYTVSIWAVNKDVTKDLTAKKIVFAAMTKDPDARFEQEHKSHPLVGFYSKTGVIIFSLTRRVPFYLDRVPFYLDRNLENLADSTKDTEQSYKLDDDRVECTERSSSYSAQVTCICKLDSKKKADQKLYLAVVNSPEYSQWAQAEQTKIIKEIQAKQK